MQCVAQDKTPLQDKQLSVLLMKEKPDEQDIKQLFTWGEHYINRPGILPKDIDSSILCANKMLNAGIKQHNDGWQGQACMIYSKIFREKGELTRGNEYARKARMMFERARQDELQGDAYVELSRYISYEDDENLAEAIHDQEMAVKLYAKIGNHLKQANTLTLLADYVIGVPDMYKAIELLHQAEALYKKIGYTHLGGVYDLLGLAYRSTGELSAALDYQLRAIKEIESIGDTTQSLSTAYNGLGMMYYEMETFEKSVDAYNKAFTIAEKLKDTTSMQYITGNLANSYIRLKNGVAALRVLKREERFFPPAGEKPKVLLEVAMVHAYIAGDKLDAARPYVMRLVAKEKTMDRNDVNRFQLLTATSSFYYMTRQYEKTIEECEEIGFITKKYSMLAQEARNYRMWYKADSARGDFSSSIRHFQLYKFYSDSLFSVRKTSQINQLQVKFDTEKKDQALELKQKSIELLTRDSQLQKAELRRARFTRNVIIFGAVMLVIVLLLGYNRYQLRLRSNRQLKVQQDEINQQNLSLQALISSQHKLLEEKEWLVKEIHHRVKNNLQIVMSLLNTQAAFLDDKDALNAIRESRFRMQAISLIHHKLYQSENMALIDINVYIHELIHFLQDGFTGASRIRFDMQIAPVKLDVSQAVPIGLILNEAITNAIKYAFTDNGTILISLQFTGRDQLTLVIADNGKGFATNAVTGVRKSMGLMLMHTLSEQLDGSLDIQSESGVVITVNFRYQEPEPAQETAASALSSSYGVMS
ncbi:histidine kinase dimerization/phosphoacceptor domain -containing protein [Chitinophaga sp. YR627]|uniref:tetratricopeptide repeat-containing sensor histidine kinase n=1 Tax=Chitinophaga sp. YR627 TaxID=1881041 RepID=UPI0015A5360D|nr:histidine kinase dimerization/phosphoacceptor domain -containing protein [Chitinophaga sp. YR627]